jgi:ABC-type phosphate transport system permease subunit
MQIVYGVFAVLLFVGALASMQSPLAGLAAFFAWALYMLLWQILRTLMAILDRISQPIAITKNLPKPQPAKGWQSQSKN